MANALYHWATILNFGTIVEFNIYNYEKYFVLLLSFVLFAVQAQKTTKIGYIDMDYILEKVPEYAEAKNQLEQKQLLGNKKLKPKNEIKKLKDALASEKFC